MIRQKCHLEDVVLKHYPGEWIEPCDARVIIVLASGKCATTTFTHLLNISPDIFAGHELAPRLWHLGDDVFKDDCESNQWDMVYWASRRDILSNTHEMGLYFGEVNHRASVFLPAMKRLFPRAKYLLLWRDFDETVISACRWGWYSNMDRNLKGRLVPNEDIKDVRCACAWYWVELYKYLLRHLRDCSYLSVPFDLLRQGDTQSLQRIYAHLGVAVPDAAIIDQVLCQKYNAARNTFDVPKVWHQFDRQAKEITAELLKCAL